MNSINLVITLNNVFFFTQCANKEPGCNCTAHFICKVQNQKRSESQSRTPSCLVCQQQQSLYQDTLAKRHQAVKTNTEILRQSLKSTCLEGANMSDMLQEQCGASKYEFTKIMSHLEELKKIGSNYELLIITEA